MRIFNFAYNNLLHRPVPSRDEQKVEITSSASVNEEDGELTFSFKLSPLTCSIFIALNPREISPGRGDLAPLPVKRDLQKLSVILSPRKPTNANEILRLEEDVFHTINLITTEKTKLIQRELDQARTTLCEMTSRCRMQDDMIKQLEALLEMRNIEGPVPEQSQFEAVPYTYITGSDS